MADDAELLDRWHAGDRASGQALVGRYFDSICRFFATKASSGLEDLVQETFLACVAGATSWRREGTFRAWLFGIARNVLRNHLTAKARQPVDFDVSCACDLGPSLTETIRISEEQRALLEALRSLPIDLQVVVELSFWEQMTGPEIADALGVPEGTARSRLRRGRDLLRQRLGADLPLRETRDDLDRWAQQLRSLVADVTRSAT